MRGFRDCEKNMYKLPFPNIEKWSNSRSLPKIQEAKPRLRRPVSWSLAVRVGMVPSSCIPNKADVCGYTRRDLWEMTLLPSGTLAHALLPQVQSGEFDD